MEKGELLPCPFCNGSARLMLGPPGCHYVRCDGCGVGTDDGGEERAVALWNRRSGVVAELRVLSDMADEEAASSKSERAGLSGNSAANCALIGLSIGHETAANLIAARIRARNKALEEAAALADQWSEARLYEANAPIISGDVFTDSGVFVQSTADANAGYRLMDLASAIRALKEEG